ncbi:MAG TPA: SAV_6107 family HEPN domain-containing protein [Pseudonocardiaceae bacterium]|nr:SAV_6107 family HEPN domain-containing protein [Pseudonocardiaceae bacterium]
MPPDAADFPTAESIYAAHDDSRPPEADVPVVAPLTKSDGLRHESPSRHNHSCDRSGDRYCPPSVRILFSQARQGLLDAEYAAHPVERYSQAHLAALRAAAAVLACRARPRRRAQRTSVWALLPAAAPELAEWSAFFAAASATKAAAEAGAHHLVSRRDADDMVRQADQFLALARRCLAQGPR